MNFVFATEAFIELVYLLWSSWKDRIFVFDFEFCSVYLLRKRKRIRKVINKIREDVSDKVFNLYDDFGEPALSHRKLDEIYINVIIQEERVSTTTYKSQFENTHESRRMHIYSAKHHICLNPWVLLRLESGSCSSKIFIEAWNQSIFLTPDAGIVRAFFW